MSLNDLPGGYDPSIAEASAARASIEQDLGLPPRNPESIASDLPEAMPGQASAPGAPQISEGHKLLLQWADPQKTKNIAAEIMAEGAEGLAELNKIGQDAIREYRIDDESRVEWMDQSREAIALATQVVEQKNYPWENASNVKYPLLTSAVIEFASRAMPALIPDRNIVKGVVYGKDDGVPQIDEATGEPAMMPVPGQPGAFAPVWKIEPGAKQKLADRVGAFMSWQILEEMDEWEEDTDKMLHILPIVGCHFKKTYFDPALGRNVSVGIRAEDLVVNFKTKSLSRAPRISEEIEYYPNEIEEMIRSEIFVSYPEFDYAKSEGVGEDPDKPIEFIEQHRRIDLDRDGYAEPYIVTIHKSSQKVARIVANYDADTIRVSQKDPKKIVKIDAVAYYTKFPFIRNPSGGFYDIGFGQLLLPLNDAINTTLNMMLDAGHAQTVGGGFVAKGLSMHSGQIKFKMGSFVPVNTSGAALRDAIVPLEFPGPSPVLFQLLGWLVDAGKMIANANNVLAGDAQAAQMQPTTVLALIEQGLKVFTGIYKRIYKAQKSEFEKLYRLNWTYMPQIAEYRDGDQWAEISREDFRKASGVCPYSDPSMVSDMQQLGRAQFLKDYENDPLCDPLQIRRIIFEAAKIPNADKILVENPGPNPEAMVLMEKAQNERIKTRAKALSDMSVAILNLAKADATGDQTRLQWWQMQMDLLQKDVEELANGKQQQATAQPEPPAPGGAGADAAAIEGALGAFTGSEGAPIG